MCNWCDYYHEGWQPILDIEEGQEVRVTEDGWEAWTIEDDGSLVQ